MSNPDSRTTLTRLAKPTPHILSPISLKRGSIPLPWGLLPPKPMLLCFLVVSSIYKGSSFPHCSLQLYRLLTAIPTGPPGLPQLSSPLSAALQATNIYPCCPLSPHSTHSRCCITLGCHHLSQFWRQASDRTHRGSCDNSQLLLIFFSLYSFESPCD